MTDTVFNTDADGPANSSSSVRFMLQWLESPQALNPADELPSLRLHLKALRELATTTQQRAAVLDGLYKRSFSVIASILPSLTNPALPVARKSRRTARSVLDLLQALADETMALLAILDGQVADDPRQSPALALWRSLHALAHQLMISNVIAAPAPAGTWHQLHQIYAAAIHRQLQASVPPGATSSLQHLYHAALLLGCAQPSSLTPREVLFLAAYFERFADQLQTIDVTPAAAADTFWIDPQRDAAAFSCLRKPPPATASAHYFSCGRLNKLLKTQLASLEAGTPPQQINLPDFAATPAGIGALRRLAGRWGESGKRRFQRRRQNYRAVLTTGIDGLWNLYNTTQGVEADLSSWMITNESPDGYALMHVTGKTGTLSVGDIAALRSGNSGDWQICMVRWAVSENAEHLELGLQILAPKAIPATLAQPSDNSGTRHLHALILPELPKVRSQQLLVVNAGSIPRQQKKLMLVLEGKNVVVREVHITAVDEQTSSVEILSIAPEENPF